VTTPAPPSIVSVTLSPTTITVGTPISAIVDWTGYPRFGVSYQWRRSGVALPGENGASFLPSEAWEDLDCLAAIDNGRGTAVAASPVALLPEPSEDEGIDFDPADFSLEDFL
jgi:hypothetical protein